MGRRKNQTQHVFAFQGCELRIVIEPGRRPTFKLAGKPEAVTPPERERVAFVLMSWVAMSHDDTYRMLWEGKTTCLQR